MNSNLIVGGDFLESPLRTFVFDNELKLGSLSIESQIDLSKERVDCSGVFKQFQRTQGTNDTFSYRIFDPISAAYMDIPQDRILPVNFFMSSIVMLKYKKLTVESESDSSSSVQSTQSKKRNRQRTVREVLESVKQWRQLHDASGKGNRMSLQEAAKVVGMSKKSLDDYYYQLRIGEQLGFDFDKHMNSKIGVLRLFIRRNKPQRQGPREKHSKRLKIIEGVPVEQPLQKEEKSVGLEEEHLRQAQRMEEEQVEKLVVEGLPQLHLGQSQKLVEDTENMYFRSFQYDEPEDPFIMWKQGDFKKKSEGYYGFDLMPW